MRQSSCSVNTPRKLTCSSFFAMLEVVRHNFNETGLRQGDLLENFKENNLARVSFLQLLSKENLLECFHQLAIEPKATSNFCPSKVRLKKYVETTWIFRSKKYVKMTWKFVEIWSSTYRRNMDVESTSIRRGVPVGCFLFTLQSFNLQFICVFYKDILT